VLDYDQAWNLSREEIKMFIDALQSKVEAKSGKKQQQQL
tara:strand:- start:499 stop:615 length:117 start_codon:yes stop_codon:yes gene_type:complete